MIHHVIYDYVDLRDAPPEQGSIYLDAELSAIDWALIESKLRDGEQFIPGQLKLDIKELQNLNTYPSSVHHAFHTLHIYSLQALPEPPLGAPVISATAFLSSFKALSGPDAWNEEAAMRRLGLRA
jgi:hypothetical protein